MEILTDNELRAVAYYSIGVSSEGGDAAYKLSYGGRTIHQNDGSAMLEPAGGSNSGYSIGTLQTDFGAHPKDASALVDSFQDWASIHHPDWTLSSQQQANFTLDLGRDGNHIRDPNFDLDKEIYHSKKKIPLSHMPKAGQDIDKDFKSKLNEYLVTNAGISFIHKRDVFQIDKLMESVAPILKNSSLYKDSSTQDQTKIFATIGKAYNQSDSLGRDILKNIKYQKINSIEEINNKISSFVKRDPKHPDQPTYMESGRDAALRGAETFNALRNASEHNPLHAHWQAVMANPLVDPTQLHADPEHPHLAQQYATVKALFVDPVQGKAFVEALEHGGSHTYGDPAKSNSRGFYAEGKDFVQWDRDGHGRAFVGGQWSEVARSELALAHNPDGTLDLTVNRNGQPHRLLHVTHPSLHHHRHASAQAHHSDEAGTLHPGTSARATSGNPPFSSTPTATHAQNAARHDTPVQAAEPVLYTPPTYPPRSDAHLHDFRDPGHPLHSRYTQFKNALAQSHTLPINGDKLPYGPAQQERLAAGFTDALGIAPHYEPSIRGFKQHQGQLLAYDQPCSFTEKSHVLRIDPAQALAASPEQHAARWKAREASHPEPPGRVIAPIEVTAEDMRHPAHPRHAMFEQARSAIVNANAHWGRPAPDAEQLDRHAAQIVVEARKFGHTEVERVHLGMPQGHATQTPNYAVQSEGQIVARLFASELAQAPNVAQASEQLQTVEQQNLAEQAMQAQRAAQMQGQGMAMKM